MAGYTGIKLIAVDMDGTFLTDNKTYNRERFLEQFKALKARGIRLGESLILTVFSGFALQGIPHSNKFRLAL